MNYRLIWERAYGSIPVDENGLSYEIHHIDGNRKNNDLSNLMCVSIREHYDIHMKQGDVYACAAIKKRLSLTEEERKELSRKVSEANKRRTGISNKLSPEGLKSIRESAKARSGSKHHSYGKKRPEHSARMKSLGFGKIRSEEHARNLKESIAKSCRLNPPRSKEWLVLHNGVEMKVKNLKKFCRENDLNFGRLYHGHEVDSYKLVR